MAWTVVFHEDFDLEFDALPMTVKEALVASATLLSTYGPML
jgi:hypothetical protein